MPTLVKSQKSEHGAWIEIRLDRLLQNLQTLKKIAGSRTQVMAVVKANAYGHGLVETAKALVPHVSYLGVSSIYEALELKERGIDSSVFLFGRLFGQEITTAVKSGITLSVSSYEEALEIADIASALRKPTKIHIKVDTGMGRLGIAEHKAISTIEKIAALPLELEGIYTHFATAEKADGFAEVQLQTFALMLEALESKGITFALRHATNSAGSLRLKSPVLNMIRPGLVLYGLYPDAALKEIADFFPILSLKSRIILVKETAAGESVGYGRTYVTKKPSTIITLPIGYSHGYPFHLSNRSYILYKGKRYPIAGRVSMDYICIDLGDTAAQAGDEVILIGEDSGASISAADLANWAGTISYEIVTRLNIRLPRFYTS